MKAKICKIDNEPKNILTEFTNIEIWNLLQIRYSELENGSTVDVTIKVFYVHISTAVDDEGKRILESSVTNLHTYQYVENVENEVTHQANIELLRVSDGKGKVSDCQSKLKHAI